MLVALSRRRSAFTLVETLVVLVIIVVAIALLLPAIQKVREASSRERCANNLRTIGAGFHQYADVTGVLPSAGGVGSGAPPADRLDWGWTYEVLPHLGQPALHRQSDNAAVRRTVLATFYCPSRRPPAVGRGGWAKCDYAGNGGTNPTSTDQELNNGLVVRVRGSKADFPLCPIRPADAGDGLATTLLVAEKFWNANPDADDAGDDFSWAGPGLRDPEIVRGARVVPDATPMRWRTPERDAVVPKPAADTPYGADLSYLFGSAHPATMNAVMGDGSVRVIRYTIDPTLFMRVCRRDDHEPVNQTGF